MSKLISRLKCQVRINPEKELTESTIEHNAEVIFRYISVLEKEVVLYERLISERDIKIGHLNEEIDGLQQEQNDGILTEHTEH